MITFDLLKIVTRLEYIQVLNEEIFEKKIKGNNISSMIFAQKQPYQLSVKLDYEDNELVIEFSGKVLGEKYSDLISIQTIRKCFDNISSMEFFKLNAENIIQDSVVVRCDVTRDIDCNDVSSLTTYINSAIKNRRQFISRAKRNGNLVIERNADGNIYKKRITIYNKEKEMNMADNVRFKDKYQISQDEFKDKCRFEINLNSMQQIRSALRISDNNLLTVLNSESDPISEFMNEILAEDSEITVTNLKEYQAYLILKDNDYDIDKVEAKLRALHDRSIFRPKREMEIYRHLISNTQQGQSGFSKTSILKMLSSQNNSVSI